MTSVTYSSTRGQQNNVSFRDVVMIGLANDKGLFIPDTIPTIPQEEIQLWCTNEQYNNNYPKLAYEILLKYIQDDQIPSTKLYDIVQRSFGISSAFRHTDVTPIISVNGHAILVRTVIHAFTIFIYIFHHKN
jgi:threonine synthase